MKPCLFTSNGSFPFQFLVESEEYLRETVIWNTGSTDNWHLIDDAALDIGFQLKCLIETHHGRTRRSINTLKLNGIDNVDIFSLTSLCPLLRRIDFIGCNFKVSSLPRSPIPLYIEFLGLEWNHETLGSEELIYILLSPNLKSIRLVACPAFCDDVLDTVFHQHRFRNLERLMIIGCNQVSKRIFNSCFMSESNVLNVIESVENRCENLSTRENHKEWLSLADSRKLFLTCINFGCP